MPGLLVAVAFARRDQPVQEGGQGALEAGLELDRPQGGRAPDVEQVRDPRREAGPGHEPVELVGQVVHVPVAPRPDRQRLLENHGPSSPYAASIAPTPYVLPRGGPERPWDLPLRDLTISEDASGRSGPAG